MSFLVKMVRSSLLGVLTKKVGIRLVYVLVLLKNEWLNRGMDILPISQNSTESLQGMKLWIRLEQRLTRQMCFLHRVTHCAKSANGINK